MNIRSKIFGDGEEASPVLGTKRPRGARPDLLDSVPVEREAPRRVNTRGDDRHRLPHEQQARVTHQGRSHDVQLVNVSGGGAMVSGDFHPMLWDRVDLHLAEDGVIECAVRWLKGDRIGLEFAHETQLDCSADEQAILLREVIARSFEEVGGEAPKAAKDAADEASDKRDERRHPMIWCGILHYDFQSVQARLRNISREGALVEVQVPLPVGAEPLLDLGGAGTVDAIVTWVIGDQAGLKFKEPFDVANLAKAKPELAPPKWERPAYLDPEYTGDSNEGWDRMSLSELKDQLDGYMKR